MIIAGQDDRVGPWVCERTGGFWNPMEATTLGLTRGDELIAGVVFDHYNGASVCMHVAGEGNWFDHKFASVCFAHPFVTLKVRKVIGMVGEKNVKALRFDKALGFVEEARIAGAHPDGDLIFLTMTAEQCRWIEVEDGIKESAASPRRT